MKKTILVVCIVLASLTLACSSDKKFEKKEIQQTVEETKSVGTIEDNNAKSKSKSTNKMSEREFAFDPSRSFSYIGNDKYLKAITDDMVVESVMMFGDQGAVEIPLPYIVKIDDSDKSDIKIYGTFSIYGYQMNGTIFNNKNGSLIPGCYHLKDDNGIISVVSKEFAEDGSNNWSSLVKICGNDEELAKKVSNIPKEESEKLRIEYAKMYANANNLRLSGIKDYGWPIILFDDISDDRFVYNFINSYFDEVRQEDYLNDMADRLTNLKERYFTKELVKKIDDMTMEVGADMVINAQDVTDDMVDTLEATDLGGGEVKITCDHGEGISTVAYVKIDTKDGKKIITDISYE